MLLVVVTNSLFLTSCDGGDKSSAELTAVVSSSNSSTTEGITKVLAVSGGTGGSAGLIEIMGEKEVPAGTVIRPPTDGVPLHRSIVGTEIYNGLTVAKRELLVGMNDGYNINTLKNIASKHGFIVVAGSQPMFKVDISSWTGTLDAAMDLMESNPEIFVANVNRQSRPNSGDEPLAN